MSPLSLSRASPCPQQSLSSPPPAGLPWSHITVDFIKGLPLSEGNIAILTIVGRFSKAVHFVPLPQLLSALETTYPNGHCVRRGAADFFAGVERKSVLVGWFLLGLPPSDQQADGVGKPGLGVNVSARHPISCSTHLSWVEYAHNSLVCFAIGM